MSQKICEVCKKQWNTESQSLNAWNRCPYCGSQITKVEQKVEHNSDPRERMRIVLKEIVETYGTTIFYDNRRFHALLKDLAPKLERERKIIYNALNENIGIQLLQCDNKEIEEKKLAIKKSIRHLVEEAWVSESGATYAVYSIVYALGWNLLLEEEQEEQEAESFYRPQKRETLQEIKKGTHNIGNADFTKSLKDCKKIGYKAFAVKEDLKDIIIPEGVEVIGKKAFFGCSNLRKVVLPKSVQAIGENVFERCYQLKEIEVDKNNPNYCSIENVLIDKKTNCIVRYGNAKRSQYRIPEGIQSIGRKAFDTADISNIYIPSTLTYMASNSFFLCEYLEQFEVDVKNNVYCDMDGVLHSKDKKQFILYPIGRKSAGYIVEDSVKSIVEQGFSHAEYLQTITIPHSVESIGNKAFEYCVMLTSITLPSSVLEIGERAFQYCFALSSVMLPKGMVQIGESAFRDCRNLTRISIPKSVNYIGNAAFYNCEKLESVILPESVTFIGDGAFLGCHSNLTMMVQKNSYAEAYCKPRNIKIQYTL